MFLAVSSNKKLSEAVSTVPDQQLSVVQVPVSELGEVVISDDADHPSLSEVVMATGTDQSLCDISIVPYQLSVAYMPASFVLQMATDDNTTSVVENTGSGACCASKKDYCLSVFLMLGYLVDGGILILVF